MELLDAVEARVLGCLMEKAVTTPDVYPLTVNSLLSACNQTTNRYPVVRYDEHDVTTALASLRTKGLTRIVYSPSNRAPKHRHIADEALSLDEAGLAVVCVLALRGPQTLGEIKGRTDRLHPFGDLGNVEATLDALARRDEPLVVHLPRQPGQKDARYAHLLCGPVEAEAHGGDGLADRSRAGATGSAARIEELTERVDRLETALAELASAVERLSPLLD